MQDKLEEAIKYLDISELHESNDFDHEVMVGYCKYSV